jgi:hypothetical protein
MSGSHPWVPPLQIKIMIIILGKTCFKMVVRTIYRPKKEEATKQWKRRA